MFARLSQSLRAPAARSFSSSSRASQAPVPRPTKPASQSQPALPPTPRSQLEQIKQYPAHPLLQFFRTHRYEITDKSLGGPAAVEETMQDLVTPTKYFVRLPHAVHQDDLGREANSRSWLASELRLKSSKDLHTLWYVLLMERNRLATAWEELQRVGARQAARMWSQNLGRKNHRVSQMQHRQHEQPGPAVPHCECNADESRAYSVRKMLNARCASRWRVSSLFSTNVVLPSSTHRSKCAKLSRRPSPHRVAAYLKMSMRKAARSLLRHSASTA